MVAFSATIYVPDNYATIQEAIDASVHGDEIIVRSGAYVENIDFRGKAISVKSEQGASVTTIDGNQSGSVVVFQNGEANDTVLDGFTITNGDGHGFYPQGGGIHCAQSSPTITNNTLTKNTAYYSGGGIYCAGGSPLLSNNIISENFSDQKGGGIYCTASFAFIINNTIHNNKADSNGGGICCWNNSKPIIAYNDISENSAERGGGGIYSWDASPTISGNNIEFNSVIDPLKDGGGIYCRGGIPSITRNCIRKNVVDGEGGGIFCQSSLPTITRNIITGNQAGNGGGFYCNSSDPFVTNNTVTMNTANDKGGGISCRYSSMIVTNTILWSNTATKGKEIWVGEYGNPSTFTISYSDVDGGQSSCHVGSGCVFNWGPGMIDAAPVMKYHHLTYNSPCKDVGDNAAPGFPSEDFDGDPRIAGGTVDIGADEFFYHLFCTGDVVPGGTVDIWVTGLPTQIVRLGYSDSYQLPPIPTVHGGFYLIQPLTNLIPLPDIWQDGFMYYTFTVPATWISGEKYYFQAMLGPWWGPTSQYSKLTNPIELIVE